MEDFIIKLENMLRQSGYENWTTYYFPDRENECILELNGDTILMTKLDEDYHLECPNCRKNERRNCMTDKKYYRWCDYISGGIVLASSIDEAKEKLQKKYGVEFMGDRSGSLKIWPWENDDYYDEDNPDVFDIYGV